MESRKRTYLDDGEDRKKRSPIAEKQKPYKFKVANVPAGWLDCSAFGKLIDCILPSKVPLEENFKDYVLPDNRYFFQKTLEERTLGLVIDLTNESGYYSILELNLQDIRHVKIPCKGVDLVHDNESVNLFINEIMNFVAHHKQQQNRIKKYILVHDTHGYNRTGFMIVHYLMRTKQVSVTQAIKIFADARPPGIYKLEYIDSLYEFYHEIKPQTFVCPPKPEWKKRPAEFDFNVDAAAEDGDDGGSLGMTIPTVSSSVNKKEPMKNDDVLGDSIPSDQEHTLRKICYDLLRLHVQTNQTYLPFPGSHPVPLKKENIELLSHQCQYSTWNADGTRYMMLITSDGCYLIDGRFRFKRVQMRFPSVLNKPHHLTLLDGEMIIDTVNESGQQVRRYLINDIMAINSTSVVERDFYERWEIIDEDVIQPRNRELRRIKESKNPDYRYAMEPFRMRRKDFWLLSTVPNLLKFIPKLSHKANGLVFQGWFDRYVPHKNEWLLQWKKETVDFLYELVDEDHLLYVHDKGKKKFMTENRIIFEENCNPSSYSGKIIECCWNNEKQMWVFMGIGSDESIPIEYNNYTRVTKTISDNISEDMLLKEIDKIVFLRIYADIGKNKEYTQRSQETSKSL